MLARPFLAFLRSRAGRAATLLAGLMVAPASLSSCLTPDIEFGPHPDDRPGVGGTAGTGGGGGPTGGIAGQGGEGGAIDPDCAGRPLNTINDCGVCGRRCTVAGGTPVCVDSGGGNYQCAVGACSTPFADCNGNYFDGCEVNTETNRNRCGDCLPGDKNPGFGDNCASAIGTGQVSQTSCSDGACVISGCDSGRADCDRIFSNGCEVNLNSDDNHCGGCTGGKGTPWDGGESCDSVYQNGSGACVNKQCVFEACSGTFDDCNMDAELGQSGNGCETNTLNNDAHCGACNRACQTNAGTSQNTCSGTNCVPTCSGSYLNCDGNAANGCESDTQTDARDCGSCNNDCTTAEGTNDIAKMGCAAGSCTVTSCAAGTGDCNTSAGDGCETSTTGNVTHCGGCSNGGAPSTGENCSTAIGNLGIASVGCAASACEILTCSGGLADCNGNFYDGCEIDGMNEPTRCGGCLSGDPNPGSGQSCPSRPNSSPTCAGGVCGIDCDSGWLDANSNPSDGCETRDLVLENSTAAFSGHTGGGTSLSFDHTLEGAAGTERLVLVGAVCKANPPACDLAIATYNGSPLTLLGTSNTANNGAATIYYALDSALPQTPGTYTIELYNSNGGFGAVTAQAVEFSGAEQLQGFAAASGGATGPSCGGNDSVTVNLASLPAGSIVYAVAGGYGGGAGPFIATVDTPLTSLITSDWNNEILFGSARLDPASGSVSPRFNLNGCYQAVEYAVGVRPEANY